MPFDEEDEIEVLPPKNSGLKKVSTQKSIFEELPKKPTQKDLDKKVKDNQERLTGYRAAASDLSKKYISLLKDKTLKQNKNSFVKELEKEIIADMVQLAIDINNDPAEQEGMGSLSWITLLLQVNLAQNNRINELEYKVSLLENKLTPNSLKTIIKEFETLDKPKLNE
jgi:hypothetical protein